MALAGAAFRLAARAAARARHRAAVPHRDADFRTAADAPSLALSFTRFRRLTLATPLRAGDASGRARTERVPRAAQEREYRLQRDDGVVSGRTCGHVESDEGLFLFTPGDDDHALLREFVPRSAYRRCEFGLSALDTAAEKWIATPRQLLEAVEQQRRMSIQPIGQSLRELGMVTQEQLERALAQPAPGDMPLGERLVEMGIISKADLQTAIAHKMGYPFVDLTRFPIDPAAARKLPLRVAVAHRALPIHLDRDRLIIAIDRLARTARLQSLYALAAFRVMPVLASKGQILLALQALSGQDLWQEHVSIQAKFFSTTR
jgi:hypothetical protein